MGGPKFRRLSERLREIGIQGVRPLTQEGAAIFQKEAAAEAYLATLTSLNDKNEKDFRMLQQYFCTWCQFNAHIDVQKYALLTRSSSYGLGANDCYQH